MRMNDSKKAFRNACLLGLVAGVSLLMTACAGKKMQSAQVPVEPKETVASKPAKPSPWDYKVAHGDTLWGLSGKFYKDPFQWPAIFKTNRDFIQDPDLIEVNQEFKIEKGLSQEEVASARQKASDTPKYVPHRTPKKKLSVDYF